jgi:uncharacterized protein YbbK (DUF523 family)
MPVNKIVVAVSSCLLGHKVRYDGSDKRNSVVEHQLCTYFDCRPICPEYAIGLGVPRAPIRVVKVDNGMHAVSVVDHTVDVTDALALYANFICDILPQICGFIFKARSPSCGLSDVPVFGKNGNEIALGAGIFANQICQLKDPLPVIDELQLADRNERLEFIEKVEAYSRSSRRY